MPATICLYLLTSVFLFASFWFTPYVLSCFVSRFALVWVPPMQSTSTKLGLELHAVYLLFFCCIFLFIVLFLFVSWFDRDPTFSGLLRTTPCIVPNFVLVHARVCIAYLIGFSRFGVLFVCSLYVYLFIVFGFPGPPSTSCFDELVRGFRRMRSDLLPTAEGGTVLG